MLSFYLDSAKILSTFQLPHESKQNAREKKERRVFCAKYANTEDSLIAQDGERENVKVKWFAF